MTKVFVGSLPWKVDSAALRVRFEEFGAVEHAIVLTDRETGRSRGFGFVTYTNAEDAQRAIDTANETELEGRVIRVASASERDPNAPPRRTYNNNGGYQRRDYNNNGGYQRRSYNNNGYGGGGYGQQQRSYGGGAAAPNDEGY